MFVIILGIRIVFVMIIGIVILVSFIGVGGFGLFILLGIDCNNFFLIFIGVIFFVVLVIIFSGLIGLLEKVRLWIIVVFGIFLLVGLGLFYVLKWMFGINIVMIIVVGKLGIELDILINMYKEFIED